MIFQTIPEKTLHRLVKRVISGGNVELLGLPGSEDDELIDAAIKSPDIEGCMGIAQVNLRQSPPNQVYNFLVSTLLKQLARIAQLEEDEEFIKGGIRPSLRLELRGAGIPRLEEDGGFPEASIWPFEFRDKLCRAMEKIQDQKVLFIVRKLHYAYSMHSQEQIICLHNLLWTLAEGGYEYKDRIALLVSTKVSISRIEDLVEDSSRLMSSLVSRFHTFHLRPKVLSSSEEFLHNILGSNAKLCKEEHMLFSLVGKNRLLLEICGKVITEARATSKYTSFDFLLARTYELSRGYFRNVWNCLEDIEKTVVIAAAVYWISGDRSTLPDLQEKDVFTYTGMATRRLLDNGFLKEQNETIVISPPLFAYWILADMDQEKVDTLSETPHRRGRNRLKSATAGTLRYLDKNKESLSKIAFDVLKSAST